MHMHNLVNSWYSAESFPIPIVTEYLAEKKCDFLNEQMNGRTHATIQIDRGQLRAWPDQANIFTAYLSV